MKRKKTTVWLPLVLASGALSLFAMHATAQPSFAVEGRAGVTLPTGDLSDAGAETGLSVGAELHANFSPNLTAYLGIHRHGFSCGDDCTADDQRSAGPALGLKYIFHSPGDVSVWGRGGIVANKFSSDEGSSDREVGFEVGVGADMPITDRIYLVPNLGFVSHDAGGGGTATFFTFGVGLHYHIN